MRGLLAMVGMAVVTNGLVAQATWQLRVGDGLARIAGGADAGRVVAATNGSFRWPAGACVVHFGVDALGKPMSLPLDVPDGAEVRVAVEPAGVAATKVVPSGAPEWLSFAGGVAPATWNARCIDPDGGDLRLEASFVRGANAGDVGLVARWVDERQHYRFLWDRARSELRLERQHGDLTIVLARTTSPGWDEHEHTLALQVEGFRLAAFCDDALVLQALDGAFEAGACGVWWSGEPVSWQRVAIAPPAAPRGSSALVRSAGSAVFTAGTIVAPGNLHVLELRLDRAHPALPTTPAGLEPWLVRSPAAPIVLQADWRESLGKGGIGEVPTDGVFTSRLVWPATPALAGQSVLVRALLVAADGEAVIGATPAVPLRL